MSSPNLPPELLDHVVDFLQDATDTLESCCLVSKSWIPGTRKHLLEFVEFYTEEDFELWKTTFQDPSTSPACYTKTLFVRWPWATPVAETKELGDWIRTFSRVVHLKMYLIDMDTDEPTDSLVPFHGFSPEIRSLRLLDIHSPLPPVFDFIHSFPLLEDLSVSTPVIPAINTNDGIDGQPTAVQYLSPPAFTGTLDLYGVDLIATQLLSLPNSLHFRKLHLTWNNEADISTTALLVESCCSTLESLHVNPGSLGTSFLPLHESYKWLASVGESFLGPINLSKATKLKYITLTLRGLNPQWVITTLQTTTPSHRDFRQISLDIRQVLVRSRSDQYDLINFRRTMGESARRWWSELDHVLVQLLESHSIRVRLRVSDGLRGNDGAKRVVEGLLPKVTARGVVYTDRRGDRSIW